MSSRVFTLAIATMGATAILMLLLLEVGVRVYAGIPVFQFRNFVEPTMDIIRANAVVMDFDPLVGWKLKENYGSVESGFSTGPLGIRANGTALTELPQGAVLAVGDSFTAGSGVRDGETWPAELERRLGTPVLNGSAGAYGTDQIVLRAEQLAETLRPSTVIVGILSQDNLRTQYRVYGGGFKPWFEVAEGKPILKGVPVPLITENPIELPWTRKVFGYSYLVHFFVIRSGRLQWWVDFNRYLPAMTDRQGVEVSCAVMQRLQALKERTGTRVIVALFWGANEAASPSPPWYGQPPLHCAQALGIETLDMYPLLNQLSKDADSYAKLWIDENGVLGHPSVAGQALAAEQIYKRFFEK